MTIRCQNCGRPFEEQKSAAKFCTGACKAAFHRERQKEEALAALVKIEHGVRMLRRALGGEPAD